MTSAKDWEKRETRLIKELSILHGGLKVSLVYVICEKNAPDLNAVYETFAEECIPKCRLDGPFFKVDAINRASANRILHYGRKLVSLGEEISAPSKRANGYAGTSFSLPGGKATRAGESLMQRQCVTPYITRAKVWCLLPTFWPKCNE